MATLEELYLLAQIARGLGTHNIDHRLRQLDFRAQESEAAIPNLGLKIADVETLEGVLVVGSNLRHEMPMLAHRIRKAAVKGGAKVAFLNPRAFEYLFPVAAYDAAETIWWANSPAVVHAAAAAANKPVPAGVRAATVTDGHRALAAALKPGARTCGHSRHAGAASSGVFGIQSARGDVGGADAARASGSSPRAPMRPAPISPAPCRIANRAARRRPPRACRRAPCWRRGLRPMCCSAASIPPHDLATPAEALAAADLVVAATTHLPESLRGVAHVVLPIGSFAESSGTFVNAEGRWQSWARRGKLLGESRPGWKVLRVLANLLNMHGVDYVSSEEVRDALKVLCGERAAPPAGDGAAASARRCG